MKTFHEFISKMKQHIPINAKENPYNNSALMHRLFRSQNIETDLRNLNQIELNSLMTDLYRTLKDPSYNDYKSVINKLISNVNLMLNIQSSKNGNRPSN